MCPWHSAQTSLLIESAEGLLLHITLADNSGKLASRPLHPMFSVLSSPAHLASLVNALFTANYATTVMQMLDLRWLHLSYTLIPQRLWLQVLSLWMTCGLRLAGPQCQVPTPGRMLSCLHWSPTTKLLLPHTYPLPISVHTATPCAAVPTAHSECLKMLLGKGLLRCTCTMRVAHSLPEKTHSTDVISTSAKTHRRLRQTHLQVPRLHMDQEDLEVSHPLHLPTIQGETHMPRRTAIMQQQALCLPHKLLPSKDQGPLQEEFCAASFLDCQGTAQQLRWESGMELLRNRLPATLLLAISLISPLKARRTIT